MSKTLIGVAAALVVMVLGQAHAQPGLDLPPRMDPLHRFERLVERLELSADQQAELREILNSTRIDTAADRERVHQIRRELDGLRLAFDEARAEALSQELGLLVGQLSYRWASTQAALQALLTTEQQQLMTELYERRAEKREHPESRLGRYRY